MNDFGLGEVNDRNPANADCYVKVTVFLATVFLMTALSQSSKHLVRE
jgi:hypothetical protein